VSYFVERGPWAADCPTQKVWRGAPYDFNHNFFTIFTLLIASDARDITKQYNPITG